MWAIAIHGGAGSLAAADAAADCAALDQVIARASGELERGGRAIDVCEGAIRLMEDSGNFIAGKGSWPNLAGAWELDAAICDGRSRKCGAVAALSGIYPPISIARAVMERTEHVLLVGTGACDFARECGFLEIADPPAFFTPRLRRPPRPNDSAHGTVGAVVLDATGAIVAGTSTGGTLKKRPGRVGDSPIIGAGTWADDLVGVSATGIGEFFMRAGAAHAVAFYRRHLGLGLGKALEMAVGDVAALGGSGGIIAVDHGGGCDFAFNSEAIRVGLANSSGRRDIRVATKPGS